MQTIADAVPAETIIVDESITSGATLRDFLVRTTADSFYGMRGGGLGWGLPATVVSWPSQIAPSWASSATAAPLRQPGVVDGSTLPDPSRMAHL